VAVSYHVGVANEDPGRTEFSHLVEHLMFSGSMHVPRGEHLRRVQDVGGRSDATTDFDRTSFYQQVPSNYLETVLWLESDRMASLSGAITQEALDLQRSAVGNENQQRRVNAPYGMAFWRSLSTLYRGNHPYAIPAENWLAALDAATVDDVRSFLRRFYGPNNAVIAVAGAADPRATLRLVERYFADIPPTAPIVRPKPQPVHLEQDQYVTLEDRVTIPALYLTWPTDRAFSSSDGELQVLARILADRADSRLFRRLVERDRIATSVSANQQSWALAGQFSLEVRGVAGANLSPIRKAVGDEIAKLASAAPPTEREVARAVNRIERSMAQRRESVMRRAMDAAMYYTFTGDPDYAPKELAALRRVTPASVQAAARRYLEAPSAVVSVVPKGNTALQAMP
jgi:zinc protease